MRAPNPDGPGSTAGYAPCMEVTVSDLGPGLYRQVFVYDNVSYAQGDAFIVSGAPTLSGEYRVLYFFGAGATPSWTDLDGSTQTRDRLVSGNSLIVTSTPSTVPGGRDE